MKNFFGLGGLLVLLLMAQQASQARYVSDEYPHWVNSNSVTVVFTPLDETPEWMAAMVRTNDGPLSKEDYDHVQWLPFKTNMVVNLGPGDGTRTLLFGFRYRGEGGGANQFSGSHITIQSTPPQVRITDPKEHVTSRPMIQLKGYVSRPVQSLKYDLYDQRGGRTVTRGDALVNDSHDDAAYFTCYDVDLTPGTNKFVIYGQDFAGNSFSTNFLIVFTTAGDTNPPVFSVTYPTDGMVISGSSFDLRGHCDDPTAVVTGLLCTEEGKTSVLNGLLERDGNLWIDRVPVAKGKSRLTIVATDAAQNSSLTNLEFVASNIKISVDEVPPIHIWSQKLTLTGFCSDASRTVTVNGVKATMQPDGHWVAKDVPVNSPREATTVDFSITADGGTNDAPLTTPWFPTVCSEPVENDTLRAGISLAPVSTNEYNPYSVCLGLTNQSGGDLPNIWMLPAEEARYAIRLYDATGREVAKQEFRGSSGQSLVTNLNIHHLGKKELEGIGGIISFSTNSTARIAVCNLDQHFKMPPPGDYRLEVRARMYKTAGDGQLLPVEFPPIATTIKIVDQPSERVFRLNDLQRQGKLTWGAIGYGLRIGVAHGIKGDQKKDDNQIEVFLHNSITNNNSNSDPRFLSNLRLPKSDEQFDVKLYDASGKEVPKTSRGKQQGKSLSLDGQSSRKSPGLVDAFFGGGNVGRGLKPLMVFPNDATDCGRFNLSDYFEIKAPGHYQLSYQQRLYRLSTNSTLTGILLPTVTVPLNITNVPGQR